MSDPVIEKIKSRLDIVKVIGEYIKLTKAGANYKALCPFHSEKTPSFVVSPARQIWHCFGACSTGGDVFKFIMKIEGIEFPDALRLLAKKAGVKLKRQNPKLRTKRQKLYEICELATKFFEKQLQKSKIGLEVKKYLLNRGISQTSIKKWRLGYAPKAWQALSDFLVSQGYERKSVVEAGLAIKKEKSIGTNQDNYLPQNTITSYDRFRGRIMFPISDISGKIIGFGGRIFNKIQDSSSKIKGEAAAKYINTPNTLIYDKSQVLYGLDKAKMEIRKQDSCILVEGYTDVIMVSQANFANVVATCGTALSHQQLRILNRYTENLITSFDMDLAGNSATKRGIDLAQTQGFNIKVITMPPGRDPAEVVAHDPKEWTKLVSQTQSVLEFYFKSAFSKFEQKKLGPQQKKEISKMLLPAIKRIPNRIEQSHWIQVLAQKLTVKEQDIEAELKKCSSSNSIQNQGSSKQSKPKPDARSRKKMLEERIISLIIKSPFQINSVDKRLLRFVSPASQEVLANIQEQINKIVQPEQETNPAKAKSTATKTKTSTLSKQKINSIINEIQKNLRPEQAELLDYLFVKSELETEKDIDIPNEIQTCLKEIQYYELKNELTSISAEIKQAELSKNWEQVNSLLKKFNELSEQLPR